MMLRNKVWLSTMMSLLTSRLWPSIRKKAHWCRCFKSTMMLWGQTGLTSQQQLNRWMLLQWHLQPWRLINLWIRVPPLQPRQLRSLRIRLRYNRPFLSASDRFSESFRSWKRSPKTGQLSQRCQKSLRNVHYLNDSLKQFQCILSFKYLQPSKTLRQSWSAGSTTVTQQMRLSCNTSTYNLWKQTLPRSYIKSKPRSQTASSFRLQSF